MVQKIHRHKINTSCQMTVEKWAFHYSLIHSFLSKVQFFFLMDSYRPKCDDEMSGKLWKCVNDVVVLVSQNCFFPVFMNRYNQSMHKYMQNAFLGSVIRSSHICPLPSDNHSNVFYVLWIWNVAELLSWIEVFEGESFLSSFEWLQRVLCNR